MPSTYAHYLYGKKIIERLDEPIKNIILNNREIFNIGLHGPDILFYFRPIVKNKINTIGYKIHDEIARDFFEKTIEVIKKSKDKDGATAYVLGFICHYILDSECHPYISKKIKESNIPHVEIEAEFDKILLKKEKVKLSGHNFTEHLIAKKEYSEVISPFFNIDDKYIDKSIKYMKLCNSMLTTDSKILRGLLEVILKVTGNYDKIEGMIMSKRNNPGCTDSNDILYKLFIDSLPVAEKMIKVYVDVLDNNVVLPDRFDRNFE